MVFLIKERLDVFLKRQVIQNYLSGQNKHMKNLNLLSSPPLHITTINNCHKDLLTIPTLWIKLKIPAYGISNQKKKFSTMKIKKIDNKIIGG